MKAAWLAAAYVAGFGAVGCTSFPAIDANVCGNAVLEADAGEDCDTFVPRELKGASCRPKGVVGECHFDCTARADGTRPRCPDGDGCAADGICRPPTGAFDAPTQLASDVSSWVSTADFDGDGRPELVSTELPDQRQQAHFRLHYFDLDGDLAETRAFPRLATRPIARRLGPDQQDALLFSNFRVSMLPGRADRAWVPATFSSYVVPDSTLRVVPVSEAFVDDTFALVALAKLDGVLGLYVPSNDGFHLSFRAPLSRPIDDLVGEPLAVDVFEGADSPCQELVLAYRGDDSFRVFDMCEVGAAAAQSQLVWRKTPLEHVVHLPRGAKIDHGPVAADINGDGHLDILIGAAGRPYVAYGDGSALDDVASAFDIALTDGTLPPAFPMPLAAGDITGDGVADFVMADVVWGSRRSRVDSSIGYYRAFANNAQPWSTALMGDLNGNGLLDVIAGTEGAPGLSFLSGSGTAFPVPTRLATEGALHLLTAGDFDGDLVRDVAFTEGGPPGEQADSLAIAFGQRDRAPLDPARIAEQSGVVQLGSQRDGGLDDVFTSSTDVVGGASRGKYTLFGGDSERLPLASFTLVTFETTGALDDWDASALQVGAFSARSASDVVAFGTRDLVKDPWTQWLLPNIGAGQDPPQRVSFATPDDVPPADALPTIGQSGALSLAGTAADLDGDGIDEALWLMPRGNGCVLLIYDIDPTDPTKPLAVKRGELDFDEPCATPEITAAELDQDVHQSLDLAVLMGDPAQGPRRIEILRNDGNGNFSLDNRTFVQDKNHEDVRAFSVFPQPNRDIAFVTPSALHVATTSSVGSEYDNVQDVGRFHDARGIVAIDPNADSVSDVVVADAEGLWLVKAAFE